MTPDQIKTARQQSLDATVNGAPKRTRNQFFGVGPITDMTLDEFDARKRNIAFNAWIEATYPKLDDTGNKIGNFTQAEFNRGMHRGYPADQVLLDMMRTLVRYFNFPNKNKIAVGLGGGHSGFSVAALHMIATNRAEQHIFVDTPRPETGVAKKSGFFRQSWGAQLVEMLRLSANGDEQKLHFADAEGTIPSAQMLVDMGVTLFFGVGHETTGATTYTVKEVKRLLAWIDLDPKKHHAVIDSTSTLGAMPWPQDVIDEVMDKCCLFTPFQKAVGGVSGYFICSLTPEAMGLIDENMLNPSWAIPRQLKIAVPKDAKMPLSSEVKTQFGPIYDPATETMLGGIINTFSTVAFAETTFAILQNEHHFGDVTQLNKRSTNNRQRVADWVDAQNLFALGVQNPESRGSAVTLLKVCDDDVEDEATRSLIIAKSKQMLGYEGLTHPDGAHEKGLDVARYVNAFPGTDGDYRAWIGGIRSQDDVVALLDNLTYCYHRAKIVVLEQQLQEQGTSYEMITHTSDDDVRVDEATRAYKVLIVDLVGMLFDQNGDADYQEVKAYVQSKGAQFHVGLCAQNAQLEVGQHFFYAPHLSTADELLKHTEKGEYDAIIAAATCLPKASQFAFGGVRIGAGTGNMNSASWGGSNGQGGGAPLMNTPSFNSRATAQMVFKALLKVLPNLPVEAMHERVISGDFDTGRHLVEYPTSKIEGKKMAVIGYGNIGREVAKLARAFGMQVTIFARKQHEQWIRSEGFDYAGDVVSAANNADVISFHLGLGTQNPETGAFSNVGMIDEDVLSSLNKNAVIINYDRGEILDAKALDKAFESGQVSYAAIDADIFRHDQTGEVSGPMQPYLALVAKYPSQISLLPHAAADTEHVSRVQGAQQAVDQIMGVIKYKRVTNLIGDLPSGYTNANALTVKGVGAVTQNELLQLTADELKQLRDLSETLAAFWGSVEATKDSDQRARLVRRYANEATLSANALLATLTDKGLLGPCYVAD